MGDARQAIQLPLLEHDASKCCGRCVKHDGRCAPTLARDPASAATVAEVEEARGRMVAV